MHVPSSITQEVREKFRKFVFQAFEGMCKKILCAVLVTCPWYEATQKERGEQARHNTVFVVYMSHDNQVMAPVNQHVLEQAFTMDEGWLSAVEMSIFSHFLVKGKTKFIELLYNSENSILYEDPAWERLRKTLDYKVAMGVRGFVEACKGQSVAGIGKKSKDGTFRLNASTTFGEFCDSFRLMHQMQNTVLGLPPCVSPLDFSHIPPIGRRGGQLLQLLYKDPDVSKVEIFNVLCQWRDEVIESLKDFKFSKTEEMDKIVGKWQLETRLDGRKITLPTYLQDDHSKLVSKMEEIGGPVGALKPEQIILIARAGSYMYGLNVASSDVDYIVIYAEYTERILSECKKIKDCYENRGPEKSFEYAAYEARMFCEMLLKGSVVITEIVFADEHEYMSAAWKNLCEKKKSFVTEKCIQQHIGLIRNNFGFIINLKNDKSKQIRKLLYQVYHKLDSIEHMLNGQVPEVRCSGNVREFIMKIRTEPLEGPLESSRLTETAQEKFSKLLTDLANRKSRLKESMDYNLVTKWLMSVRNINS